MASRSNECTRCDNGQWQYTPRVCQQPKDITLNGVRFVERRQRRRRRSLWVEASLFCLICACGMWMEGHITFYVFMCRARRFRRFDGLSCSALSRLNRLGNLNFRRDEVVGHRLGCTRRRHRRPVSSTRSIELFFDLNSRTAWTGWIGLDATLGELIPLSFVHSCTMHIEISTSGRHKCTTTRNSHRSNAIQSTPNDLMATVASHRVSILLTHYYLRRKKNCAEEEQTPRPHLIIVWHENFWPKCVACRTKAKRNEERKTEYNRHECGR